MPWFLLGGLEAGSENMTQEAKPERRFRTFSGEKLLVDSVGGIKTALEKILEQWGTGKVLTRGPH